MTSIRPSIHSPSGYRHPEQKTTRERPAGDAFNDTTPPRARGFKAIPSPEALNELVKRAVSAMKSGVYWDRGSILNIEA